MNYNHRSFCKNADTIIRRILACVYRFVLISANNWSKDVVFLTAEAIRYSNPSEMSGSFASSSGERLRRAAKMGRSSAAKEQGALPSEFPPEES